MYTFNHGNLSITNSLSHNNSINRYKILPGITRSELAVDEYNFPAWLAAFETAQFSKNSDKQPIVAFFFFSATSETFTRQSVRHKGVHTHESTDRRCQFLQMQSNKLHSRNLFGWLIFQNSVCFFSFLKSRDWRFSRLKARGQTSFGYFWAVLLL